MKEGLPGGGLSFFLGDCHDDSWADAPPFSPRGENGPRPVQKTRQEGDFGLPLLALPFKRHKEGAAAPSLETPPTERQREEKLDALTSTLE